ncbi:MAG: hypothetical protein RLZZ387_424 [Chloroflexota bacterium]|jgi:hypothetical protein
MATLRLNTTGELSLTLAGAAENHVLMTLRRWPHWLRANVERSPDDQAQCLSVTLVADPVYEPTLRGILKHGFGMTFPSDGGDNTTMTVPVTPTPRKRR